MQRNPSYGSHPQVKLSGHLAAFTEQKYLNCKSQGRKSLGRVVHVVYLSECLRQVDSDIVDGDIWVSKKKC